MYLIKIHNLYFFLSNYEFSKKIINKNINKKNLLFYIFNIFFKFKIKILFLNKHDELVKIKFQKYL